MAGRTFLMEFAFDENLMNVKGHRKLMNYLHRQVAQRHKTVTMRDHFTRNAKSEPGGEYGFSARSPKYLRRKARLVGPTGRDIPNVLYGDLRSAALQKSIVTATQYLGRLQIKGPTVQRNGKGRRAMNAERRAELEVVAGSERHEINQFMEKQYVVLANTQFKSQRRQRIRG